MKKIVVLILALVLSIGMLTACGGGNDEKVDQLRQRQQELVGVFNETLELYEEVRLVHDVEDVVQSINELSSTINDLDSLIKDGMSDSEIEAISEDITEAMAYINQTKGMLLTLAPTFSLDS